MSTQTDHAEHQTTGKIKWYSMPKGYGFIEPDEGGPDVLLHAEVIKNGRYLPQPNDRVICGYTITETGRKATWLNRL